MNIVGIYTCRNAIEAGYPFVESILSVMPVVDEFLVNDGGSDDGTLEVLEQLDEQYEKMTLLQIDDIESEMWDTIDYHIEEMIDMRPDADWFFESQADEMLHEEHAPMVRDAIEHAHENGYNGIRQNRIVYKTIGLNGYQHKTMRAVRNVDGLRSIQGGDCFYIEGEDKVRDGFTAHNMQPEYESVIPLYHLNIFGDVEQDEAYYDRHADYLAPESDTREDARENWIEKTQ